MKKLLLGLVVLMSLLVAACGGGSQPAGGNGGKNAKGTAKAGGWVPKKDIEFVIPFGAGGGNDVMVRKIIEIIKKENLCPVNIVPVNKKGGSGVVGYTYLKSKGKTNEYTLSSTSASFYTQPIVGNSPFKVNEDNFAFVAHMVKDPVMIAAYPGRNFKSLKDIVTYAKAHPDELTWGGVGNVSDDAIIMYMLNNEAGVKIKYVPYDDGGLLQAANIGGHIDLSVPSIAEGTELMKSGKLTPIAACADKRFKEFPDIPTTGEAGYKINHQQSRGIIMNPGVSKEVREYYSDLFKKVSETKEWKDFTEQNGMTSAYMPYNEYAKFAKEMAADYEKYLGLIKKK
jgi:putative tricarboxylic transport membrane protein